MPTQTNAEDARSAAHWHVLAMSKHCQLQIVFLVPATLSKNRLQQAVGPFLQILKSSQMLAACKIIFWALLKSKENQARWKHPSQLQHSFFQMLQKAA